MGNGKKHTTSNKKTGLSSFLGISVALTLLGLAVYAGFYMEKNTYIHAIDFHGTHFADENELLSSVDHVIGIRADSVHFDSLYEQLLSVPYVKEVSVKMSFRGKLTFLIREHQPIAMLVRGSNRNYLSEGGNVLPILQGHILNVPLVYGIDTRQIADSARTSPFWITESFLKAVQNNEVGWATISEIAWTDHEGIVALTHDNGVKLIFGQDEFETKLSHWRAFYSDVVSKQGIQSFEVIDLRFRDQIVTRNF